MVKTNALVLLLLMGSIGSFAQVNSEEEEEEEERLYLPQFSVLRAYVGVSSGPVHYTGWNINGDFEDQELSPIGQFDFLPLSIGAQLLPNGGIDSSFWELIGIAAGADLSIWDLSKEGHSIASLTYRIGPSLSLMRKGDAKRGTDYTPMPVMKYQNRSWESGITAVFSQRFYKMSLSRNGKGSISAITSSSGNDDVLALSDIPSFIGPRLFLNVRNGPLSVNWMLRMGYDFNIEPGKWEASEIMVDGSQKEDHDVIYFSLIIGWKKIKF